MSGIGVWGGGGGGNCNVRSLLSTINLKLLNLTDPYQNFETAAKHRSSGGHFLSFSTLILVSIISRASNGNFRDIKLILKEKNKKIYINFATLCFLILSKLPIDVVNKLFDSLFLPILMNDS